MANERSRTTPAAARWFVSAAIVVVPFLLLSRRLNAGRAPRTYQYAQ